MFYVLILVVLFDYLSVIIVILIDCLFPGMGGQARGSLPAELLISAIDLRGRPLA